MSRVRGPREAREDRKLEETRGDMLKFLARPTLMAIATGGSGFRSVGAAASHGIVTGWCRRAAGRRAARTAFLPTPALTAPPTPTADGNFVIGPPYPRRPSSP